MKSKYLWLASCFTIIDCAARKDADTLGSSGQKLQVQNVTSVAAESATSGITLPPDPPRDTRPACSGLGATPATAQLTVTSLSPLVVSPPSLQFTAQFTPAECFAGDAPAAWSVDKLDTATIDSSGRLSLYSPVATDLVVTAYSGAWKATATASVVVRASDTSHAPAGADGAFAGVPSGSDVMTWLYPYSQTVFPLEIRPPVVQWDNQGTPASAVKLSLRYPATGPAIFEWSTIFAEPALPRSVTGSGSGSANVISKEAWTAFEQSARGKDAAIVLQRVVGGVPRSEVSRTIRFATAALRGRIYYTEYSRDAKGALGHAYTMTADPGATTTATNAFGASSTGCPVCHSISANGRTFVTSDRKWSPYGGVSQIEPDGSFTQTADAPQYPGTQADDDHRGFAWGAITPDGKYVLEGDYFWGNTNYTAPAKGGDNGTGKPYAVWQTLDDNDAPIAPKLVSDPSNPAGSWGLGDTAMMVPSFSPDGTKLVFVDGDTRGGAGWRKGLSIVDFDEGAKKFSNRRAVYSTYPAGDVLKWPTFEPDSRSLLFVTSTPNDLCYPGACSDRTQHGYGNMAPTNYHTIQGLLWSVDSQGGGAPVRLDNLNRGEGEPTLRRAVDADKSFQPTALPVVAGGYRWTVFTSTRPYGNTQNLSNWTDACLASQLWVAAIDDAPSADADRSHPAFWLPNQNVAETCNPAYTNERAFWVLDPCRSAGSSCATTADCCQPPDAPAPMACQLDAAGPPAQRHCVAVTASSCARDSAECASDADCCGFPASRCIGAVCAIPPSENTYTPATVSRDFDNDCSTGTRVVWTAFEWKDVTPADSQIRFVARTADRREDLATAVPVLLAVASGAPVIEWTGADVDRVLAAAGQESRRHLRIDFELGPSSDHKLAPTVTDWRQSFDCADIPSSGSGGAGGGTAADDAGIEEAAAPEADLPEATLPGTPAEAGATPDAATCERAPKKVGAGVTLTGPDGIPLALGEGNVIAVETRAPGGTWTTANDVQIDRRTSPLLEVALVADNSGSERGRLAPQVIALKEFSRALLGRSRDNGLGLVRVSTWASVVQPLTRDEQRMDEAVATLSITNGWTALWDGIRLGNGVLEAGARDAHAGADSSCYRDAFRSIVVFTDGYENNSSGEKSKRSDDGIDTELADLLKLSVGRTKTAIYAVGIGRRVDADALRALAEQTGGRYVPIDDWSQLLDALSQTAATLQKLTPVCFVPASCNDTEARVVVRGANGQLTESSFAIPVN